MNPAFVMPPLSMKAQPELKITKPIQFRETLGALNCGYSFIN
jgi:hypothetical protein